MKLYIPEIGHDIKLLDDWTFKLHRESRNGDIWDAFAMIFPDMDEKVDAEIKQIRADREVEIEAYFKTNPDKIAAWNHQWSRDYYWEESNVGFEVTLPANTILRVDRIYIRKGVSEYSSVTFWIIDTPLKHLTPIKQGGTFPKNKRRRFWAKLYDVNNIEFEHA